jgi:hypothetical protein
MRALLGEGPDGSAISRAAAVRKPATFQLGQPRRYISMPMSGT